MKTRAKEQLRSEADSTVVKSMIMEQPMDIDAFWEYGDPATSEVRFRTALADATPDETLELLTQIARTYSLRRQFDAAHQQLDAVEIKLSGASIRPRIRYLLERGRTFNSAGDRERARALFVDAWEAASSAHEEGLAVDAAHMVAITYGGSIDAVTWNQKGIALARHSEDPKARALLPAMLNNNAWDLHDLGRFEDALALFHDAERAWSASGKSRPTQIARWSIARCLRSLQRHEEAIDMLRALETEYATAQITDGYLAEELGENLLALGLPAAAKAYFQSAAATLAQDQWFATNEADRLERLQRLATE